MRPSPPCFPPDTKGPSGDAPVHHDSWLVPCVRAGTSDLSLELVDGLMTAVLAESRQDMVKSLFECGKVKNRACIYSVLSKAAV